MALWSNTDANTSAPQYTVDVVSGNTGVQAYQVEPIGTWGVDAAEAQATNVNGHAGWVLRTVGSGGRAGRVTEETLVAMGSMNLDGADDPVYPDAVISIDVQPQDASNSVGNSVVFSVTASSVPPVGLSYQWYGPTGELTGETNTTLTISNLEAANDASEYFVTVAATGADTVTSANAVLTVV